MDNTLETNDASAVVTVKVEETEATSAKVSRKPKLTLGTILENASREPDNIRHYEEWAAIERLSEDLQMSVDGKPTPYSGWWRYRLDLGESTIVIIARQHPVNFGWQIKDYILI